MKAPDDFGRLLALGITTMVVGQALVNLSVVLGLLPTKGIPLPFVSYGGSSLLGMLLATGVLLNISQHADRRDRRVSADVRRASANGNAGPKTLLIAGGGTGGHVFPALAVAREWLRREENSQNAGSGERRVVFVGTERGIEAKLVPQAGTAARVDSRGGPEGHWRRKVAAQRGDAARGAVGL